MQVAISESDVIILKKSISCSYPNLPFDKALKKEHEKLQAELQQSQANMDVGQCEVIERLMEVTEIAVNSVKENDPPHKVPEKSPDEEHLSSDTSRRSRFTSHLRDNIIFSPIVYIFPDLVPRFHSLSKLLMKVHFCSHFLSCRQLANGINYLRGSKCNYLKSFAPICD